MPPYALRVTLSTPEVDARALEWIRRESPGHLVIKHSADKEVARDHWHALIWDDRDLGGLRPAFKKANPALVNTGLYSLSRVKDGEEDTYERYMCHADVEGGEVCIVSAAGVKYTRAWAQEQNRAFYAAQRDFARKKKTGEDSKAFVKTFIEECEARGLISGLSCAKLYLEMSLAVKRPVNEFSARAAVNLRMCSVDPEPLAQRIWPY